MGQERGLRARGLSRRSLTGLGMALFAGSLIPLTMSAIPATAATTAGPDCSGEHNLNDPTGSSNQVLDSYSFSIEHGGKTITVCTLFGNVSPGDVVTAHLDVKDGAKDEVTLASYEAKPGDPSHQTLFACASFTAGTDADSGSDSCHNSSTTDLTVNVPDCGFQIDLIYGDPVTDLVMGFYADQSVWINGQAGDLHGAACPAPPGPTPTPTPTPVPGAPTPTPSTHVLPAATSVPSTGGGDPALIATLGSLLLMGAGGGAVYASRRIGRRRPPK